MVLNEITKTVCHVERNLKYLKDMPRVGVNNIRDFKGAFKKVTKLWAIYKYKPSKVL